ncbi:MAG: RnfABCDGE type electron transport complex subunit C [Bacilli bacterium]
MKVNIEKKHTNFEIINKLAIIPNKIYIPLMVYNNYDCVCKVKVNDYVYKHSIIGFRNDYFKLPIHSTISGTVIEIKEINHPNGNKVKTVVIQNDYKEQVDVSYGEKKELNKYTRKEVVNLLKFCGVTGMGGSDFPTYVKYETKEKINSFVVNAVECEPYIKADLAISNIYIEEILETLEALIEIYEAKEAIIVVKQNNKEMIDSISKFIGTYPQIKLKLVEDYYPSGWEKNVIKDATGLDYNKLPIEKGIIINNISTFYAIYCALKFNTPITEKIISIGNDEKIIGQKVKIGTLISDLIEENKEKIAILGGPMMGNCLNSLEFPITKATNSILLLDELGEPANTCLRCARCHNVCPVGLSPVTIMNSLSEIEYLKKLNPNKCIECGLCSYICPARILVRESVKIAKEILKNEK